MNDTERKLKEALRNALSLAFTKNEETICELPDIEKVAGWYRETKEHPNKIPSMIINRIIRELLEHSEKYFDSIIEHIETQCQINVQQRQVKSSIRINFKSIKPYVEFIKVVDGARVPPTLRFTFKIDIEGTFEGLKIQSKPTVSVGQGVKRKEISLDKFSFDLTVSIIKLPTINLVEPIFLFHKEQFKVENLHFYL